MNTQNDDMINLRAAILCSYAADALRAANNYESAGSIYSIDTSVAVVSRTTSGIECLCEAAKLLGFTLTPIANNQGGQPATEPQVTPILSTAGGFPQNEPSALQDIDEHADGYSAGLSGRLA